ncbi:hypothetical protein ACI39X_27450, partial [Klebsiella pneumoniae]
QIAAEEERTGVKDAAHFAYSMFAKAAATRRENLLASVEDLRVKLDNARRELEDVSGELAKLEPQIEMREQARAMHRRVDRVNAMLG